jgi:hypothetical protein
MYHIKNWSFSRLCGASGLLADRLLAGCFGLRSGARLSVRCPELLTRELAPDRIRPPAYISVNCSMRPKPIQRSKQEVAGDPTKRGNRRTNFGGRDNRHASPAAATQRSPAPDPKT